MNFRYRYNQIKNSLFPPRNNGLKWVFIYGLPRSGTTYYYHQWMNISKVGISDYDLRCFLPVFDHFQSANYIPFDTAALKTHILDQLINTGAPGGGSSFDFVVKQVHTGLSEFELLCEILGSKPSITFFLYREPIGWYHSASRKFNTTAEDAYNMYSESLNSYDLIGGEILEYGLDITASLQKHGISLNETFDPKSSDYLPLPEKLEVLNDLYQKFQRNHRQ